jgi:AraC family transcriptional regulator of adaptative response / DNA-3-methyladenine glycosylase II
MTLDREHCFRIAEARDPRFDGWVYCGVTSTGIYCRPSCPARTPKRANMRFFSTPAAAQAAGFRACKRCRPDAVPGSPEWDARADVVGRAMRLIGDGVVDRDGVAGLAANLGYSERQLNRQMVDVVGAGPLAIARARRAQTARTLLEGTTLPIIDVAAAAGFSSVRQFNATVREVFADTPSGLRRRGNRPGPTPDGAICLRLAAREPVGGRGAIDFLGDRAVAGVEEVTADGAYRRSLRLPHAAGVVELAARADHVGAKLWLEDLRDLATAVQRCRRMLDLDSDPQAVLEALGPDPLVGPLVRADPGGRVPGHVDGAELAVRAVLGQQVSVAAASTYAARLVQAHGEPLRRAIGGVTHLFPAPAELASAQPAMPRSRAGCLRALATALASGSISLDAGADREETERRLAELPGVGAWTVAYISMRALRWPDAFLPTDLGVRHALEQLGQSGERRAVVALAERWRPYRAYATMHLWAAHAARSQRRAAPLAAAA